MMIYVQEGYINTRVTVMEFEGFGLVIPEKTLVHVVSDPSIFPGMDNKFYLVIFKNKKTFSLELQGFFAFPIGRYFVNVHGPKRRMEIPDYLNKIQPKLVNNNLISINKRPIKV